MLGKKKEKRTRASYLHRVAAVMLAVILMAGTLVELIPAISAFGESLEEPEVGFDEPVDEPEEISAMSAFVFVASDWDFVPATRTIRAYTGSDTEIEIPEDFDGVPVEKIGAGAFLGKGLVSVTIPDTVTEIGSQAFQDNSLTFVDLPPNLTKIGSYAFFQNRLTTVDIPEGVTSIGEYAFRTNQLTGVGLPATVTSLPTGVFMDNQLTDGSIDLSGLSAIGSSAFEYNRFTNVTLPAGMIAANYGDHVFADNGRFVTTSGSAAKTYAVKDKYGEISAAIRTVTVKFQTMTGTSLRSDMVITTSLTTAVNATSDLIVDGNTFHFSLDNYTGVTFTGYAPAEGMEADIPISGNKTHIVKYDETDRPPVFAGVDPVTIMVGASFDPMAGVSARDADNNPVEVVLVSITPGGVVNTGAAGLYTVRYRATDDQGRSSEAIRIVFVGPNPMALEFGGGWAYEDFTYSADGKTLNGLSSLGIAKVNGGRTTLWIPDMCPMPTSPAGGPPVAVEQIRSGTSSAYVFPTSQTSQQIVSVNFSKANGLKVIGEWVFQSTVITSVNFGGAYSLTDIKDGAFYNAKLTSLDLSPCTNLVRVGTEPDPSARNGVFYSSQLTSINWDGLDKLEWFGRGAFYSARLPRIDFSNLPSLRTIGHWSFSSSPCTEIIFGNLTKLNLVGAGALQSCLCTEIDMSGCTALTTIGSAYNPADSSYRVFGGANLTSVKFSPALRSIGCYAFANANKLPRLDFSVCPNLAQIGSTQAGTGPFAGATSLTSVNFSNTSKLTLIGDTAFQNVPLTSLDLSDCVALTNIADQAFYTAKLTSLDLTHNTELTNIGQGAFHDCTLTTLDLTKNTKLATIGSNNGGTPQGTFHNSRLTSLDLTHNTALTIIGTYAFENSYFTTIDFSKNVNLTTIGKSAFTHYSDTMLDFSHNTKLTTIGWNSFYYSPLELIDLRNTSNPTIENIASPQGTFVNSANNCIVYAPQTMTNAKIPVNVFGTNNHERMSKATWIYTYPTTTTGLADWVYSSGGVNGYVFVNKVGYWVELRDQTTGTILRKYPVGLSMAAYSVGDTVTQTAPSLLGFTPVAASKNVTIKAGNTANVVLYYTRDGYTSSSIIDLTIINRKGEGSVQAIGGTAGNMELEVSIKSEPEPGVNEHDQPVILPAGSEIVIPIFDANINLAGFVSGGYSIQPNLGDTSVSGWYFDALTGELHLILKEIKAGVQMKFPIKLDMLLRVTPNNWTSAFNAYVLANTGTPSEPELELVVSTEVPATLQGTHSKNGIRYYVNNTTGTTTTSPGLPYITIGTLSMDGTYILPGTEKDVSFGWEFNTINRNISGQTVIVTLPMYRDVRGDLRPAQFIPGNNPAWDVIETATFTVNGGTVTLPTKVELRDTTAVNAYGTSSALALKLRFPEAKTFQDTNYLTLPFINLTDAADKNGWEETNRNSTVSGSTINTGGGYYFGFSGNVYFAFERKSAEVIDFRKINDRTTSLTTAPLIFDTPDDKGREFHWPLQVVTQKGFPLSGFTLRDWGLDPLMMYAGLANPNYGWYHMEITAYGSDDTVLFTERCEDKTYYFPVSQRGKIDHIEIELIPVGRTYTVTSTSWFTLVEVITVLKDPTGLTYDKWASGWAAGGLTEEARGPKANIVNRASVDMTVTRDETGEGDVRTMDASWYYIMRDANGETMSVTKSQSTTASLFPGQTVSYGLGISGVRYPGSVWDGFMLVDLIPDGMQVIGVTLDPTFQKSIGAGYFMVDNYQGTGRTAVVIVADELRLPTGGPLNSYRYSNAIATVTCLAGYTFSSSFTNHVYGKVEKSLRPDQPITLQGLVNDPFAEPINGGGQVTHAQKGNGFISVQELMIFKNIIVDGQSSTFGLDVRPRQEFEYRIQVHNATQNIHTGLTVYDIFPFSNDATLEGLSRGTQLIVTLTGAPTAPAGYDIWYTEDENAINTRAFLTNPDNWSQTLTVPGDYSKVRGVKFVAQDGVTLNGLSNEFFTIPMKAPADPTNALGGLKAQNTASYSTSTRPQPNESGATFARLQARGDITLRKVDAETKEPLKYAEFTLYSPLDTVIMTRTTGADGTVTFPNLPVGTYKIKETKAPEGYYLNPAVFTVTPHQMINGETYVYHIGDVEDIEIPPPPDTASVTLTKHSGAGHPLAGVNFRITGTGEDNAGVTQTKMTNAAGKLTFFDLPLGDYHVEELSAPGWIAHHYTADITLDTKDELRDLGASLPGGVILNKTADIIMTKIGIFFETYQQLDDSQLDDSMGIPLEGVTFTLKDGLSLVDAQATDAAGRIVFAGLELGKVYTLQEDASTVPAEFEPRATAREVMVDFDGVLSVNGEEYDRSTLVIGNNCLVPEYHALLKKVDEDGEPIEGVRFLISTASAFTSPKNLYTGPGGVIDITVDSLKALFGASIPNVFYLKEAGAPAGYYSETGPGAVWQIDIRNPYDSRTFINRRTGLVIHKYATVAGNAFEVMQYLRLDHLLDGITESTKISLIPAVTRAAVLLAAHEAGLELVAESDRWSLRAPLSGAVLRVYRQDDPEGEIEHQSFSDTTVGGVLPIPPWFEMDETKVYLVKELTAPYGFSLVADPYVIDLSVLKNDPHFDGTVHIDFENIPIKGRITVTKLDRLSNSVLAGVGFNLYRDGAQLGRTAYTDANGSITFANLPYGTYVVQEVSPASGYELDGAPHTLVIGGEGLYRYLTLYNETTEKYANLEITKTDGSDAKLPGIAFCLQTSGDEGETWTDYLDTNEQPYRQTNSAGVLTFQNLPAGMYKIVEISDSPLWGEPIFSPSGVVDSHGVFTVSGTISETIRVGVKNPDIIPTAIHKNIENESHYVLSARNDAFTWNVAVTFGNRTSGWTQAVMTDAVEDVLEVTGFTLTDSGHHEVEPDRYAYDLDPVTHVITVTFNPVDGSFAYLNGETYTAAIETRIRSGITDAGLLAYSTEDGIRIPNQAVFDFGGEAVESETPTVAPPAVDPDIHKDVNGVQKYVLGSVDEVFTWNVEMAFGNLCGGWGSLRLTDQIEDVLEIRDIAFNASGGVPVPAAQYELTEVDNLITVTFNRGANGFDHLIDKTYILSIDAVIRSDADPSDIDAFMEAGGIPNQAFLAYQADPRSRALFRLESEIPTVELRRTKSIETITVSGKKVWIHGSNPETGRPAEITVQLKANGTVVQTRKATESTGWEWSFENVDKYDDGSEIVYTVDELPVTGYTKAITGSAAAGFIITNTYSPGPDPTGPTGGNSSSGPKTGDEFLTPLWVILMALAAVGIAVLLAFRKKWSPCKLSKDVMR